MLLGLLYIIIHLIIHRLIKHINNAKPISNIAFDLKSEIYINIYQYSNGLNSIL